jgi:hypothetical protein
VTAQASQPVRRLPLRVFRDKMQGAWLGQMIGVGWGAPTEFKATGSGNDRHPKSDFIGASLKAKDVVVRSNSSSWVLRLASWV